MAFAYTIKDQFGLYFVTFTVHQWADVFTRRYYANIIIESLQFCQKEKKYLQSSCAEYYGNRKGILELAIY